MKAEGVEAEKVEEIGKRPRVHSSSDRSLGVAAEL